MDYSTITITFGDVAENHPKMQKLGTMATEGFTVAEMEKMKENFISTGCQCEMISLPFTHNGAAKDLGARVLVIRDAVDLLLGKDKGKVLFAELSTLNWDKKAVMRGRVVNKRARWNLCFDEHSQGPDYEAGKGRIVPYKETPFLKALKDHLKNYIGEKSDRLVAEGNFYYDVDKCYIGAHGDGERRLVVGVRLGASFPLHFQWHLQGSKIGDLRTISLNHGDIYVMSDPAVGWNWLKRNVPTLRHSAGFLKNLK